MTKKLWLTVTAMLTSLVCVGLVAGAQIPRGSCISKENFDLIEKGMTKTAVEEIFGKPGWCSGSILIALSIFSFEEWSNNDGTSAHITFQNGAVQRMTWTDPIDPILEQFHHWYSPLLPFQCSPVDRRLNFLADR